MKKQLFLSLFLVAYGALASAQHHPGSLPPVNSFGPAQQPTSNAPSPKRASTPVPRSPAPKGSAGQTTGSTRRINTTQPTSNKPKPGLAKATKLATTTVAPRMVRVNRWVSPLFDGFTSIPESQSTDSQLTGSGYKDKTFQYEAFLTRPEGDNVAVVNRWGMPNCKDFILIAEHEINDTTLTRQGYKNKQLLFYAYKNKPATGKYIAVNRWHNTSPTSEGCTGMALSVMEQELTDAQLISLGYTGKMVQFYVPAP